MYRWARFCKHLPKFGWNPIVLTVPAVNPHAVDYSLWNEVKDHIIVGYPRTYPMTYSRKHKKQNKKWIYIFNGILNNTIYIPDAYVRCFYELFQAGIVWCKKSNIQAIVATGSPFSSFLVGAAISKYTGIPLALDFRDLWTDDPFIKKNKWSHKFCRYYIMTRQEEWAVRKSHVVISVTQDITKQLEGKYRHFSHILFNTITNGYSEEDFSNKTCSTPNKYLVFSHVGTWCPAHPLDKFLLGLHAAIDERPEIKDQIRLVLCGELGPEHLSHITNLHLKENIIIKGYVSHQDAIQNMLDSHILLLSLADLPNYNGYLSGKIFEYLRAGRRIFAIVPPEGVAANLIRDCHAGFVVHPDDVSGIKYNILKCYDLFVNGDLDENNKHMSNINQYESKSITEKLASFLDLTSQRQYNMPK